MVEWARNEDLNGFGHTGSHTYKGDVSSALLSSDSVGSVSLNARSEMVVCGLPLLPMILSAYGGGVEVRLEVADGSLVEKGRCLARLDGKVVHLLQAERVMLNFLQRLSGVATETRNYVTALGNSPTRLLDTRKTIPGYRFLEKYAVACGGGWNHRYGLYDRVMLKDNHLAASGALGRSLGEFVRTAMETYPDLPIEVEVDRMDQIPPVVEAGADIVMLDNFDNDMLAAAVGLIDGRAATEASGGITIERLPSLAGLGLDFISTGATVHQSHWCDIGLDWE